MRVLLLNQTFYPDVASTAQHLADVALALGERGHDVTVVTGRRAYAKQAEFFARTETWRGIKIRRVLTPGLGKSATWRRLVESISFMGGSACRMAWIGPTDVVVALTSPPLISLVALALSRVRRNRLLLWVMDLNPDEAIAAGWLNPGSFSARLLERLSRLSLRSADCVVALDQPMAKRIRAKGVPENSLMVIPPWSHDPQIRFDPIGRHDFRRRHGLDDHFVVMYSGNHSACHPLETLLTAARKLSAHSIIKFCFVGGGTEFRKIQNLSRGSSLQNLMCLPYQPLAELSGSLSAADVHVVVMGNHMVGIVHPCKVYNLLHIGSPLLYIGPAACPTARVITGTPGSAAFEHGDAEGVARHLLALSGSRLKDAQRSAFTSAKDFSKNTLLPRFIELVEKNGRCGQRALSRRLGWRNFRHG